MSSSHQPHIFITGTDTNVGKTIVASLLVRGLRQLGIDTRYWKPVQTGEESDTAMVARIADLSPEDLLAPLAQFALAASPDQAAAAEWTDGPSIDSVIEAWPRQGQDLLITEGAGGLLVPLNQQGETWLDLLDREGVPVVIVARPGLGTINHTSLTLRMLQEQGVPIAGIVFSGEFHPGNADTLGTLLADIPQYWLPHVDVNAQLNECDQPAQDLARFVLAQILLQNAATPWLKKDADFVWHPYTQHATADTPLPIIRAKGPWLTLATGEKIFDGTSSWWVQTLAHGRPEISRAIKKQQATLDHVIFAGVTHAPAAQLAERLVDMTRGEFTKVFYSDNGSTAVEIGLKMAWQSWVNRGITDRKSFLAFRGSYHGDTIGTMAIADASNFHEPFRPLFFQRHVTDIVTSHDSGLCPGGPEQLAVRSAELTKLFAEQHHKWSAVLLEPMLQGAGGMQVHDRTWLRHLGQLCKQYGIPLVLDEVFSGLGRVAANFAYQRAKLDPDIICIAKGLTGGTMPLAATLAKPSIYDAFSSQDRKHALLHGHSYTGNPVGCAAAIAAMDVYADEQVPLRAWLMEQRFHQWLHDVSSEFSLQNVRALGAMLAFELPTKDGADYFHPVGKTMADLALKRGLHIRPLGNTVYLVPPIVITDDELEDALDRLAHTLHDWTKSSSRT